MFLCSKFKSAFFRNMLNKKMMIFLWAWKYFSGSLRRYGPTLSACYVWTETKKFKATKQVMKDFYFGKLSLKSENFEFFLGKHLGRGSACFKCEKSFLSFFPRHQLEYFSVHFEEFSDGNHRILKLEHNALIEFENTFWN